MYWGRVFSELCCTHVEHVLCASLYWGSVYALGAVLYWGGVCAMPCFVLKWRMAVQVSFMGSAATRSVLLKPLSKVPTALRTCYAVPSTDLAYVAMPFSVLV